LANDEKKSEPQLPCFEDALEQLGAVVQDLEEGQIGLSQCLARYEEGVRLLKQCYGLLEHAERRIELLSGVDASGNPITQPFEDVETGSLAEKAQSRSQRRSKPNAQNRAAAKPSTIDEPTGLF
jgi:exodeoxyribonuclease VII small subunit